MLYKSATFYAKQSQFQKSQMNVNQYNTMNYENKYNWTFGENKPNSNPNKPNFGPISRVSNPKQTQSKPICIMSDILLDIILIDHYNAFLTNFFHIKDRLCS